MAYTDGSQCQFTAEHTHALTWGCAEGESGVAATVINSETLTKIWQSEGAPTSDWNLSLDLREATPRWKATGSGEAQYDDTSGEPID